MELIKKSKPLLKIVRLCKRRMSAATQVKYVDLNMEEDEIMFKSTNSLGVVTLNRPKVLNAMSMHMTTSMQEQLEEWEKTKQFIILQGAGGRAFSAGGDLTYALGSEPGHNKRGKAYFRAAYTLLNFIETCEAPCITLMNGITMGAGLTTSIFSKYGIATENTLCAMPETTVGFYPDAGASYFLPRLRGKLGLYLGLTGRQLRGADVVKAGMATHFITSSNLLKLYKELTSPSTTLYNVDSIIANHTIPTRSHTFSLEPVLSKIDHCFSANSVEGIIEKLEEDKSQWATDTANILKSRSPVALKVTKRAYDLGSTKNLQDCFRMEFRITANMIEARVSKDFYEGVRALLIEKDNNPKWSPKTLEEVTEDTVSKYFAPLTNEEEEITYLRSRDN